MTPIARDMEVQLHALASQLRAFNGHRTLWIDDASGQLVHTEPDAELEDAGYRLVGTVNAPTVTELGALLADRIWLTRSTAAPISRPRRTRSGPWRAWLGLQPAP